MIVDKLNKNFFCYWSFWGFAPLPAKLEKGADYIPLTSTSSGFGSFGEEKAVPIFAGKPTI